MRDSDVRERPGWTSHTAGPGFDLMASKLRRPVTRPGTISRTSLIDRMAQDDSRPIVSVIAPPGYGKTTLLAQWAAQDRQASAWVSLDERDNDPTVLLSYVAAALDAVEPVGERVFEALTSPASSVPGSVVPRLCSAFAAMTAPVTLVLDDVHLLENRECQAALSVLAEHVPTGARLVLAGRAGAPLRAAHLRAEDRILEIGPADLALDRAQAAVLLREAGVVLGDDEVALLHERTEGWPAGLYLAALYLREGGPLGTGAVSFGGDDRLVSEYMEAEFLARISARDRVFLTRTAVLERMCGSLCEALLDESDAAATLAEWAGSNLLLVPLDRRGEWYRYHHLFRDMLLAELERLEPGLLPVLRRRAAAWYLENDQPKDALEYSIAANDVDTAARLVGRLALPAFQQGRVTTLRRWLEWLDDRDGIEEHPIAAVWASHLAAQMGRPAEAERWADVVDRRAHQDGNQADDPAVDAWAAVLRAALCRGGVKQMRADADEAARRFAAAGIVAPVARLCQGLALVLSGDPQGADVSLAEAIAEGEHVGAPAVLADIFSERSLLAIARGDWNSAEALASQARAVERRADIAELLVCAVQARIALYRGDVAAAQRELVSAQRLRPLVTYVHPHLAVQARIELIRVHLALTDMAGARALMREIDEILEHRPDLGTLVAEARALRARLSAERTPSAAEASSLTAAELRVLPMLATHLSFPEIGAEMFLSPHTVKSQAMSIYRKLGASSRHQAVTRSRELGLLEG